MWQKLDTIQEILMRRNLGKITSFLKHTHEKAFFASLLDNFLKANDHNSKSFNLIVSLVFFINLTNVQ